ncbi:protein rolling stone-like [Argonauta hians]
MAGSTRSSLIRGLKEELKLENFFLKYQHPEHFVTSSFKTSKHFYLAWNILWSVYHVVGVLMIFLVPRDTNIIAKVLVYATIWGYLALSLTVFTDLAVVICFQYIPRFKKQVETQTLPLAMKILWIFSNVSYCNGVLITCGYWILLYNSNNVKNMYLNVMEHAINSVYILLNMFVTAKPMRIYHVWQSIVTFLIYILFSLVYFFSGGTSLTNSRVIYFFTDWGHPSVAIPLILLLLFVGLPIVHTTLFFIYKLRLYLTNKQTSVEENIKTKNKLPE